MDIPNCTEVFTSKEYCNNYSKNRWMNENVFEYYINQIVSSINHKEKRDIRILDIGCGVGQYSIRCSNWFKNNLFINVIIDSIDISAYEIEVLNNYLLLNNITNINTYCHQHTFLIVV